MAKTHTFGLSLLRSFDYKVILTCVANKMINDHINLQLVHNKHHKRLNVNSAALFSHAYTTQHP